MNRLILVLLMFCLPIASFGQSTLPNGKSNIITQHPNSRQTGGIVQTKRHKTLPRRTMSIWDRTNLVAVTSPLKYKEILLSHPCWNMRYHNSAIRSSSRKGKTYFTKDIFRICEFTKKGVWVYYTPESAKSLSDKTPFVVSEFVPFNKVKVLGISEGQYVISVILDNREWKWDMKFIILPSTREDLCYYKKLVRESAKVTRRNNNSI